MTIIVRAAYVHYAARKFFRTEEPKPYRGTIDVGIIEVAPDDVPVAVRIAGMGPEGGALELRHDGGSLWRPLRSPEGRPMTAREFRDLLVDPRMMRDDAPYWADYPFPKGSSEGDDLLAGHPWIVPLSLPTIDERLALGSVVFSDADVMADRTESRAHDLASIGGVIHVRCAEPVWCLDLVSGTARVMTEDDRAYGVVGMDRVFFRLDDAEVMASIAEDLGLRLHHVTPIDAVKVLDPGALRMDPVSWGMRQLYHASLREVDGYQLVFSSASAQDACETLDRLDGLYYDGKEAECIPGLQAFVDLVEAGLDVDDARAPGPVRFNAHLLKAHARVLEQCVLPRLETAPAPAM